MKLPVTPLLCLGALAPFSLFGQAAGSAFDLRADVAFAGRAAIAEGSRPQGEIDSWVRSFEASRTMSLGERDRWSIGGLVHQVEFSPPTGAPIPRRLGALALQLGYTRSLDQQWTLRAEVAPGFYGESLGDGMSVPANLRLAYAVSRDLQWFAGIDVDTRSAHPVVGGVGVRWHFAKDWTLALLLPEPRLEYAASPTFTLFAGASGRRGTYSLAKNFGRVRGRPELDGESVDYRELAATAGARWQLTPAMTLSVAGGWMWDRRFEFTERRLLLNGAGAPAVQVSLRGGF